MKESFDENFMADLQQEEEATKKIALEGPELEDDGKEEREVYQAECNYAPAEGF